MPLTVGGGVRSEKDIRNLLLAGADKVSINTAAVQRPLFVQEAANRFGSQCIVVAIDAKRVDNGDFQVFTHGGRKATGINAVEWAKQMVDYGAGEILLTSMDRDGTKQGFDIPLTKLIASSISIPLVASGGVGSIDHFSEGVIEGGASAVLAASVFHFGQVRISDVKANMSELGLPVRL